MKNAHKTRTSGESCSCTTCVYKSESDHPSLRRIINLGSRIDRLYYGKYIPLRERKLLDRLVRTRAVYDDIRAQLVSDSTLSLSTKGDYNPRKKVSVRELDDTEKSSGAVLELVNMVDRGAIGSKKLDDCCSCCSCSSKIKIHEHRHRQKRTYEGVDEYLARQKRLREIRHRKKGVRFQTKHIRSDPCTCTFKLIKKHSKAMFRKMHQGPPAPLLDLQSKTDEEIKRIRERIGDIARSSYQNLKQSNTRMKEKISEGIFKLRESQTRIKEKIELQAKLSKDILNQARDKLTSKIREINKSEWQLGPENELAFHVRKDSISKFKEELRRKQIMKDWECEPECFEEVCVPEECFTKLKQKKLNRKNIHNKGMNYNIKKQERKAGEPLRHYDYKIQAQKSTKAKRIETKGPVLRAQQSRRIQDSRVSYDEVPKKAQKEKEISILKIKPVTLTPDRFNLEHAKITHSAKKAKLENSSLERKSSQRQAVRIGSSFSFNVEFYKDKPGQEIPAVDSQPYTKLKQHPGIDYRYKKPVKDKKTKKRHLRQQGSQIQFKRTFKDTQTGGRALKRCFCTLKLKPKATKSKIRRPVTKKVMTTEKSALTLGSPSALILNDAQTNTEDKRGVHQMSKLLSYECEPGVCIPGDCDPYQCIEIIKMREAKHKNSSTQAHKTKSTSSYTPRSYKTSKAKNVQSKVSHRGKASKPNTFKAVEKQRFKPATATNNSHRQAVRIGSTFSFNLEFYKDSPYYQQTTRPAPPPPSDINTLLIKPKQKAYREVKLKDRGYQGDLENVHKNTPTQVIKKKRNALIGTTFRRCFCTLALQGKDVMKNHSTKTFTVGTETSELKPIDTANKGTKTKLKYSQNRSLEPYECEPFTCVPGRCDPYICLDRINMRKTRLKKGGSASDRHETSLEPYECEPFTCIPGECDPHVCLERINKRNKRFREVGLTTAGSKTTSSSSGNTYKEKSLRTVRVQYKPKQKERKILARTQKHKKYAEMKSEKYDVFKYPLNTKSRQAVKIGSTFSFDIEFYKNRSPTQEIKEVYSTERKTKAKKKLNKNSIDKGIKMNRLNVAQEGAQVQGPKKRDKGSIVRPLLKRCFCTLNLQKKWKHQHSKKEMFPSEKVIFQPPRIYTVNRVMIKDTQDITRYTYRIPFRNSSHKNLNNNRLNKTSLVVQDIQDNINKIDKTWKPSTSQQFKKTNRISSQQCVKRTDGTKSFTSNPSSNVQIHKTRFTSLTRYFRRCYYTMNLKVENESNYIRPENEVSSIRKRALHKLLPYECEPGVCIPGECNPYECQKMIAKRLMMKSPSKKSGTEYSSHSISSSANQPMSRSKQYKQQTMIKKSRQPQVYKEKPHVYKRTGKTNEKQAVRIGSSFSFDIEFSKKLATSHKDVVMPKYSSETNLSKRILHSKSKGTGNKKLNSNSQSQSASVKTIHRGSLTKPTMKRCFCTLKLQKKGRLYEEFKNQQLLSDLSKEKTVSRGQNTKKIKPFKLSAALKPYECEPNICIPGQCDPHQCLERIKKRYAEEVATNTIVYDTKSISSMNTDNQRKKIQRSRAVSAKPKKSTITEKGGKKYPEYSNQKPLREAVRVGSSFSFNIEFYKDVPPSHPHGTHTYVKGESKDYKHSEEPLPTLKKHVTNKYVQNNKNLINKQSQFGNLARHASTLTNSFIKRCFCTAQLYKTSKNMNKNFESKTNETSPTFIKRCFCVLKKIKLSKNKTKNDIKTKETQDKNINTFETKVKLEPYECMPGICLPGECDPYICDKIMKKYRNQNSKAISCDTLKTRSISSNSANIPKKNVKSSIKRKQNLTTKDGSIKTEKVKTTKIINKPNATSWSPNRNVVRIGSQFSFDIEFFKEHPLKIKRNQKSITPKRKSLKDTEAKKKVKINSTKSFSPSYISQSSQVKKEKVKDHGVGINYLMKRCFCTLKLNENNKYINKAIKKEEIDDKFLKKVKTKSVMTVEKKNLFTNELLPYECEPNTCTPYQCDPYECEKRIKLRYKNIDKRELGVSTSLPKKISVRSMTDTKKPKTKIRSLSTKNLQKRAKKTPRIYSSKSKIGQPKQSVRIGSAFSFNIEFFKDKPHAGVEFQKLPKKDHNYWLENQTKDKRKTYTKQTNHSNKIDTSQTQVSKKFMSANKAQLANQVMRTQSTMTGFEPKKRCFCTLYLKKSKDKLPLPAKTLHASTETEVFKTTNYSISNLLPYECEPNICVPGECNPVQCLDKIKQRHNKLLPYECEPNICIPGECNPVQCLERIKQRHNKLLPYECEPNICIPGECNPVQCLERIKSRNKTFGTGTKGLEKRNASTLMKHANDAKNEKSQIKQLRQPITKKRHIQKTDNNKNRQAVRISSNFSFDVEFFRTNNLNASELPKLDRTKHQFKNKTAGSNLETKKLRNRALQSSSPKKVSHGASVGPFLKRCFCTLKLQKALINKNPIIVDKHLTKPRHISTESKGTAMKKTPKIYNLSQFECEPFSCIPGQCDPYECAKRIEMRNKKHKSQYTITQSHNQSHKGVGIKQDNMKSQRNQANFVETNAFVPKPTIDRPEMVGVPRFATNKQAVRIGSKFSFNVEFYKEKPPTYNNPPKLGLVNHRNDNKLKKKKQKNIHHDAENTDRTYLRSTGSEYDKTKTRNVSVKAENSLKRCFCTLELQKRLSSKNKKQNIQNKVPFAQNFEVRRVAVQHNPKMLSKGTHIGVKSISTKINKKRLKRNDDSNIPCNLYICKNGEALLPDDNMKTILPFIPEKFNKTISRTVLPQKTKYDKSKGSKITNRGKKLTRKTSKKHLHNKQPITQEKDKRNKSLGVKKIIECCAKIFKLTPKSQNFLLSEKNERQASPDQFMSSLKPNKCKRTCPYYSVSQNGDTKQGYPRISVKLNKKEIIKLESINKKSNTKQQIMSKMKNKESFCPCSRKLLHKKQNTEPESLNISWNPKQEENIKINESRDRSRPLKVSFFDTVQSDKKNFEKLPNSKNKRFASGTKSERLVPLFNYCHPCKGKIIKEEFHKAAGDQLFINQKLANKTKSNCNEPKIISKIREVCCSMHPEWPLFEMQVDSENYEILNRNEVIHNIPKLNTKCKPRIEIKVDSKMHKILNKDKLCPCRRCICGPGADSKILKLSGKPCICGSSVCAKKLQSVKMPITRRKWKTCLCGSPVCDKESTKLKSYVENKCLCQKEMAIRKAKLKAKKLAIEKKERASRLKAYKKSDKLRRKKRKIEQKRLEKKIDKKATDGILFAESALDVGKLGITAATDILRQVARCARDPKQAYRTLRTLEENPMLIAKFLKSSYNDTGFNATLRRVRLRCLSMKGVQKLRRKLESNPVTKYLMYICSKDPRRRLLKKKKKKPQRVRERMDFNCSLYMASLRRRPFLSVYDRWPWFYQHFLNLVHAWKQFLDICTFLLAAVVWSPCILCMEICRACLCCFFCTG